MEHIITVLSQYFITILMILFTFLCFTIFSKYDVDEKKHVLRKQLVIIILIDVISYALLHMKTQDIRMVYMGAAVVVLIAVVQILYRLIYKKGNILIINNMCMLLSIGFIMISRLNFDKAMKQFQIVVLALIVTFIVPVIIRKWKILKDLTWLYGVAGLGLLGIVLIMAVTSGGAKLSIEIAGVTFQFSELVKITFVFFVAGMFRKTTEFRQVVITTIVAAAHVMVLVLSRDLGNALVFYIAYLVMLYVATKKPLYALSGLGAGAVASVAAYYLFNHVKQRVVIWQDPISVYNEAGGGYQIVQGLFGISSGSWFGVGLGDGMPKTIPVVEKDEIFAAICEEMGIVFAICMLLVCMSLFLMIVNISMKMSKTFYKLIAMGLGAEYAFQVFLTVGGNIKFIPMTGITLPFVSYGGSSVICAILIVAIIQGLYILREDEGEELAKKRREEKKRKNNKKNTGRSNGSGWQPPKREKTLEEKIQEQTEESLRW